MTCRIVPMTSPPRFSLAAVSLVTLALISFAVPASLAGCQFPISVQTNRSTSSSPSSGSRRGQQVLDDSDHPARVLPPRDWVSRVRDQFTEFDHQVTISGNVIRTISATIPHQSSSGSRRGSNGGRGSSSPSVIHSRLCVQVVQGDRYIVAHEEPGQSVSRYTCIRFVHRSPDVVQILEGPLGNGPNRSLCRDHSLRLNRWLMIDRNGLRGWHGGGVTCPLSGGFSMHIFDKGRNEGVCDAYLGETRIESECQRGDGLIFRFRRQTCVPQDLYMHSTQPVTCLTSWTEESVGSSSLSGSGHAPVLHTFTLLRHAERQHSYYWLLRTPVMTGGSAGQQFAAYLFKDLVADTSNAVNETRNYIRFDAVRDRVLSEECGDEYEICSDLAGNGQASSVVQSRCNGIGVGSSGIDFRLTCPLTCGLCNASLPVRCSLPPSWNGQWRTQLASGPRGGGTVETTTTTINSTTISTSTFDDSWHCIQWNASGSGANNEVMLMTDFNNGCRRRFRCARVLRQTAALVYLHISRSAVWPFTRSGRDPIDCRAFRFDAPTAADVEASGGGSGSYMVALYSDDDGDEVTCEVPPELIDYTVVYSSSPPDVNTNSSCSASLTQMNSRTRVQLDVRCNEQLDDDGDSRLPVGLERGLTSFACLASLRSVINGDQQVVVARRVSSPEDDAAGSYFSRKLVCWLFTSGGGQRQPSAFQMFVGSQCDAVVFRSTTTASYRPPTGDPLPSTATFRRTSTPTTVDMATDIAGQSPPTSTSTRRPFRTTRIPRPSPANGGVTAGVDLDTTSAGGKADSDTQTAVLPPRLQNSTSGDVEAEETSMMGNAVTVAAVVFILAIIQAIALCKC